MPRRDLTPERRARLTPGPMAQQRVISFEESPPLTQQALMGYNSDSAASAESRYSELVADEAGYEPDAEMNHREVHFVDCHDWELVAPRGERHAREVAERLRRESNFRRRKRDLNTPRPVLEEEAAEEREKRRRRRRKRRPCNEPGEEAKVEEVNSAISPDHWSRRRERRSGSSACSAGEEKKWFRSNEEGDADEGEVEQLPLSP